MISSMGKTNASSLAYHRLLCNLALVALLSPASTLSAQEATQKTSPPPAAVTTLNPTDLTDFANLPPLIQTRLTAALAQELPPGLAAVALNPGVIHTDMLTSCFAESASEYPTPEEWIKTAGPFILKISPRDNGRPLTVPC